MDGSNFSAAVAAKTQWTATLTNFGIHLFVRLLCKRTTHDLTAKLAVDDRPATTPAGDAMGPKASLSTTKNIFFFLGIMALTEVASSSGSQASPTGVSVRAAARTRTGS
jgi:hypothetical protein